MDLVLGFKDMKTFRIDNFEKIMLSNTEISLGDIDYLNPTNYLFIGKGSQTSVNSSEIRYIVTGTVDN